MKTIVWDTSAIVSFKGRDYPPPYWLWKDLADGWISDEYTNIIPSILFFEYNHAISRKNREGNKILRELYLIGEREIIYPIDEAFIRRSAPYVSQEGFDKLKGSDLIFACIAKIENAYLVTLDDDFRHVSNDIKVINLSGTEGRNGYEHLFSWAKGIDQSNSP